MAPKSKYLFIASMDVDPAKDCLLYTSDAADE